MEGCEEKAANLAIDVGKGLHQLCKSNPLCSAKLHPYLAKQIWTPIDRKDVLNLLADLFLEFPCTEDICWCFRSLVLDVVVRSGQQVMSSGADQTSHQRFCIALSKAISIYPYLKGFALDYVGKQGTFISDSEPQEPEEKKRKRDKKLKECLELEICRAAWRFARCAGHIGREVVPFDTILPYLRHRNKDVRWFAMLTVVELLGFSPSQRQALHQKLFGPGQVRDLALRHNDMETRASAVAMAVNMLSQSKSVIEEQKYTKNTIVTGDLCDGVVAVCGVLLPRLSLTELTDEGMDDLVMVPSTQSHLHSLALAVSSSHPTLLQGPVGSGKTTLVEELARLTGRSKPPHFMKIQLGDQTDSKALLGTYRCTDVPGEFVWQPGPLTQAVSGGHWVLLEDIDYAPMDVISVLLPLLESGTLSLPGHGDNIHIAPSFRIFLTQRLLAGVGGWYSQHGSNSVLLEKLWTKVNVEPLSRKELQQVISTKYPQLTSIVDRLLDIYVMVCTGKHDISTEYMDTEYTGAEFSSHDGRLISTRDLMTWCRRIAVNSDLSSPDSVPRLFLEALDCFCSHLPRPDKRLLLAHAIAVKLNVGKVKAEFYCSNYKPHVEISPSKFTVGRACLARQMQDQASLHRMAQVSFAFTRQSAMLLERVAVCVSNNEPVLLVGETGTGKTSAVQFLAQQLGHNMRVINMNQQSDSADLLGGFKPVELRHIVGPFKEEFELLFCQTFSRKRNTKFLQHVQVCFVKRRWTDLFSLLEHTQQAAVKKYQTDSEKHQKWIEMGTKLHPLRLQVRQTENALAFAFIEGTLVKALRSGDWVLLDEINLASAETLECLSGLLESTAGSVVLSERGDTDTVTRAENFRLFACMNPATDVGKRDLPLGIRNRFTELYVDELVEVSDLKVLTAEYLSGLSLPATQLEGVVKFYLAIREQAMRSLTDGTGHKPHFSLRTLCRALRYAAKNPCVQVSRSLYEGFCLSFLTQLDRASHPAVEKLVCQYVIGKANVKSLLRQELPQPPGDKHVNIEGYWIATGHREPHIPDNYILTPSVRANLKDLSRIVSAGQHPVLLQGETSVGKTSLVTWLAHATGNQCVRVNNHEHTDLQEYVGCYAANETGKLVFKEGVLVEAMRTGHWIILDELNLAPSDVLEALNRLLDDNRELFIPETQETVRAHHRFMLFATQNPPGQYGGRKILSRAFRNRFVELHFDEIPSNELETILHKCCALPMSYGHRLVTVMLQLQVRRRGSGLFAGKQGFMTLRDLFRWANRFHCSDKVTQQRFYDWDQHMADHGYMLLAGRVRRDEECVVVCEVIEKHLKRSVDPDKLYTLSDVTSPTTADILKLLTCETVPGFEHVVWTYNMRRLAVLVAQTLKYKEPVLLVGDTGCGKTTVCQLMAGLKASILHSVNCHMHSESADFLGGLRPVRDHSKEEMEDGAQRLFEWVDGPLVLAMRQGHMFLIDEISLADDSVLERLNSVLEPERNLLLAEKGGGGAGDGADSEVEQIQAEEGFSVLATMNPGGDYGKKELSPALRNRFTEIWCEQVKSVEDLVSIIEHNLNSGLHLCNQEDGTSGIGRAMIQFVHWFSNNDIGKRCTVSVRDFMSWVRFMNTCGQTLQPDGSVDVRDEKKLEPAVAYIHGACLVFLDGLGSGVTSGLDEQGSQQAYSTCLKYLVQQVNYLTGQHYSPDTLGLRGRESTVQEGAVVITHDTFSITPFSIHKGPKTYNKERDKYALQAPTPCMNAQRILRALQLPRPILLEGSPGVGKTSLVSALAKAAGRDLVRINLSEQTDVTDLFGADLPMEGEDGGMFSWRDGPLLRALKLGHWVVLDELNLASQSVLEGLNACFDHRAEVFVPELGRTFHIQHENTRIFACQNPLNQGGGRKGLPKSFLNRFTQVYVEALTLSDLVSITSTMYPNIPLGHIENMVTFNQKLHGAVMLAGRFGQRGAPWEFNLRDVFRWCDLMLHNQLAGEYEPGEFVSLIYRDRMRTELDKSQVLELYQSVCPESPAPYVPRGQFSITAHHIQVGLSYLARRWQHQPSANQNVAPLYLLHHSLVPLESLMKCVQMNWMAILVGSQSSGKTSLVKLLSELTGNTLHILAMNSAMDTTELLGGFEQSDLVRHLKELSGSVGEMVRLYCVDKLLQSDDVRSNTQSLTQLYQRWHKYTTTISRGETRSSVKEVTMMKDQVRQLNVILNCLEKLQVSSARLSECRERLSVMDGKLEGVTSRLGGGTFEWIDSLLVRALQAGHWLLIDNVNFCRASVLDRLNALLEPNGVLTVNERGVIDGQVPLIEPHPDFRLLLAMDPKFGEISRAMRNRGVEIYITGESEGGHYDDQDVKTMLHGIGLMGKEISDWLIDLHRDIRGALIDGERPTVHALLHVAVLTKQEMDRGVPLSRAIRSACTNVYIHNLRNILSKQKVTEILKYKFDSSPLASVEVRETFGEGELGLHPVPMPNIEDYSQNATLANVMKHSAMISCTMSQIHKLMERSGITDLDEMVEKVQDILMGLKYGTQIVIEQSSFNDWPLCVMWLEKLSSKTDKMLLKQWLQKTLSCPLVPEVETYSINLSESVKTILETMFSSAASGDCKSILQKVTSDTNRLLSGAHDPRWSPQSVKMVCREKYLDIGQEDVRQLMTDLEYSQNRLYLVQFLAEQKLMVESWFSNLPKKVKSPLGISFVFHQGGSGVNRVELPVLVHLYPLVREMFEQMEHVLLSPLHLPDQHLLQIVERFGWFKRLIEWSQLTPAYRLKPLLPLLNLHWNWFYSKTFVFLQDECQFQLSDKLKTVVSSIQSIFGENSLRNDTFLKVWDSYGHPNAFHCRQEAELHTAILAICQRLQVSRPHGFKHKPTGLVSPAVDAQTIIKMAAISLELLYKHEETRYNEVAVQIDKMESGMCDIGLVQPGVVETDHVGSHERKSYSWRDPSLRLQPLFDLLTLLAEQRCGNRLVQRVSDGTEVESLVEFTIQHNLASPVLVSLLNQTMTIPNNEIKWPLLITLLVEMHWRLWNGPLARKPLDWITGKEGGSGGMATWLTQHSSKGPGILQLSPLTFISFHILHSSSAEGRKVENSSTDLLPVDISVGEFEETRGMFMEFQRLLWSHSSVMASRDFDIRMLERRNVMYLLIHLLDSLRELVTPAEVNTEWNSCIQAMKTDTRSLGDQNTIEEIIKTSLSVILGQTVTDILLHCLEDWRLLTSSSRDVTLAVTGTAWVHLGLLQSLVLAPEGPVDPLVKQRFSLQYIHQEMREIEAELTVRNQYEQLLTGHKLDETRSDLLHPRVKHLFERQRQLEEMRMVLEDQQAYRPDPPKFNSLLKEVGSYQQTTGKPQYVLELLSKLHDVQDKLSTSEGNHPIPVAPSSFQEEQVWQASQQKFLDTVQANYSLYRDLLEPFILAVHQMRHGMRMVCQAAQVHHQRELWYRRLPAQVKVAKLSWLEDMMECLCKFPSISSDVPDQLSKVKRLCSEDFLHLVKFIAQGNRTEEGTSLTSRALISKTLMSALQFLQQYALLQGNLQAEVLSTFSYILDMFVSVWREQESSQRQKEEEESSLFRFRPTSYGDGLVEEERDEKDFRNSFPTFEQDFTDLNEKTSLDDSPEKMTDSESAPDDVDGLSENEMVEVWNTHCTVFTCLTRTDWLARKPIPNQCQDHVKPILSCYQVAAALGKKAVDKMYHGVDKELIGSHLVVIAAIQHSTSPDKDGEMRLSRTDCYDIYHDPNVTEAIKCGPLLERFMYSVRELQVEWPDHPALKQMCVIVERIVSFPVTSPLIRFVTGLELLLNKAQDWESNAAKYVSLCRQLAEVSELIVQWRKLELGCWSRSLETVEVKCRQQACKWWFHLYQLVQSTVDQDQQSAQIEVTQNMSKKDVLSMLTQFLESSPLGEFSARLEMIYSFHCQLVHSKSSKSQDWLLNQMWNLYQFYRQFLPAALEEVNKLRSPIEKELKGFVKIARWNDINYWALKQATEKTHRTIHKHIKAFQTLLARSVKCLLVEGREGSDNAPSSTWSGDVNTYVGQIKLSLKAGKKKFPISSLTHDDQLPLQSRLPLLVSRMSKHCVNILNSASYHRDVIVLDELTGELIEAIQDLQALDINKCILLDQNADKDKQKSEAKNINLRKRKALSDLFKCLTQLGLSYRKGLTMKTESTQEDCLNVPPVDISVLASQIAVQGGSESGLSKLWRGCDQYYYTSVSRRAQLMTVLQTPSQELGVGNIDRCRGFSEQMMHILTEKHKDVTKLSRRYSVLRRLCSTLKQLSEQTSDRIDLPPQDALRTWATSFNSLLCQVIEGLRQFLTVLQCCPTPPSVTESCLSPLPMSALPSIASMKHGDERWVEMNNTITASMGHAEKLLVNMHGMDEKSLLFWCDLEKLAASFHMIEEVIPKLTSLAQQFDDSATQTPSCLSESLYFLCSEISSKYSQFNNWKISLSEEKSQSGEPTEANTLVESQSEDVSKESKEFAQNVEELVAAVLLAVQTLTKKSAKPGEGKIEKDKPEEDSSLGLRDNHLTAGLHADLQHDMDSLQCPKVMGILEKLFTKLRNLSNERQTLKTEEQSCSVSIQLLVCCMTLVHQYTDLVEYYLAQIIASDRATGKLLSILLKLFTELALKGFCLPAELSGEMDGEGATEFEDIEGGGIGEGEGVKDVSDQIETEGQLEDAQKAGEEKKEGDPSEEPDIKSEDNAIEMSEDIEGKLHDMEPADGEESDENEEEEDRLDKQMGEVDQKDADKLDEQMWGSDEEEESIQDQSKEESGPGAGKQSKSKLVAKEDNPGDGGEDKDKPVEDREDQGQEEDHKPHNLDQPDEEEYDEDRVDPYYDQKDKAGRDPETMDLPEDISLDEGDEDHTQDEAGEPGETEDLRTSEMETGEPEGGEPAGSEEKEEKGDNPDMPEEETEDQESDQAKEMENESHAQDEKDEAVAMETDPQQEEEGQGEKGLTPQDEPTEDKDQENKPYEEDKELPHSCEQYGQTSQSMENTQQSDMAKDRAGQAENNQDESDGTGRSITERMEGHEGQTSAKVTRGAASQEHRSTEKRKPGQSKSERSLGSVEKKYKQLRTLDTTFEQNSEHEETDKSDLYEHIKDSQSHSDVQTMDVATSEQDEQQSVPNKDMEESEPMEEGEDRVGDRQEAETIQELKASKLKPKKAQSDIEKGDNSEDETALGSEESEQYRSHGDSILTLTAARGPNSTIHTAMEHLNLDVRDGELDVDQLRSELEVRLSEWRQPQTVPHSQEAMEAWYRYEALTLTLSQQLCEQLRLVLEPTQATKLKGDYRTGKRLNMRKVIPYIASQFRKDKIWLRRTKPSKREYQILLAIDDSSSMMDNHSKQLAFESLAVIANALSLLESGQLAICSFGESVKVLHPFTEQFTNQSGAKILQHFTFQQKKTKIAQLLKETTAVMLDARCCRPGGLGHPETAQLLLVVSDGRGLFMEGMEVVKSAVRQAHAANIFLVFVVIDNPLSKDSILDIKVPHFKGPGQLPEIRSYMDHFPFPFYVILRDINSLPYTLSDALRQWFEVVTAGDR